MSDKTDYERLCREVEKIDMVAAKYLRDEAPKLDDFEYDICLPACFLFIDTKQGWEFWWNITEKLSKPYGCNGYEL